MDAVARSWRALNRKGRCMPGKVQKGAWSTSTVTIDPKMNLPPPNFDIFEVQEPWAVQCTKLNFGPLFQTLAYFFQLPTYDFLLVPHMNYMRI